ncbi:hypothetical protein BB561_004748 [Smittium simulii]|uniref:N-terminal of MaoC-like dehydratase domain-containing protein n=1 Tax=Smittium simulii TaxID=133385 RepID=A0A2T9YEH2_9FUNG|nr:hypothetical protein BB561_004748 [Smittium simulii]
MYFKSCNTISKTLSKLQTAPKLYSPTKLAVLGKFYSTHEGSLSKVIDSWSKQVLNKEIVYNDNIDGRRVSFLRNVLAPHMPADYPALQLDPTTQEAAPGTPLFANSHLAYFWLPFKENELSFDGYFAGEAPPPPFKQRVWAGGNLEFTSSNQLLVGQKSKLVSVITSVIEKSRTPSSGGPLAMIQMKRSVFNDFGLSLVETRELAYMLETNPNRRNILPKMSPDISHTLKPTEITLFRYSALTWNSHRIHYDQEYTRNSENHPAVLVHGPLTCTLLLEFLRCHTPKGYQLAKFKYRAVSPLYVNQNLTLCIKWSNKTNPILSDNTIECDLWALNGDGGVGMSGKATLCKTSE